MIELYLRVREL